MPAVAINGLGRHLSGWPSRMPDAAEKYSGRFGGSVRSEVEEG
jgi:hypothetical protein